MKYAVLMFTHVLGLQQQRCTCIAFVKQARAETCVFGQVMVDFHACQWPMANAHDTSLAEYFDNLNEPSLSNLQVSVFWYCGLACAPFLMPPVRLPLQALDATCQQRSCLQDRLEMEEEETGARSPLITFSHFLPHQVPLMQWQCRPVVLICYRRAAARSDEMFWRGVAPGMTSWCAVFCLDACEHRAGEVRWLTKAKQCAGLSVRDCCGSRCCLRSGCCSSQTWPRRRAATTSRSA